MIAHSQLAPLPAAVPFRIVSKTIGQGAYACIKKAIPPTTPHPIFAVKFIHKDYACRRGGLTLKQIELEYTLHAKLGAHPHIVQFFHTGEDASWRWIAMELADGGDLFDKIESDVGVGEDVAHVYFAQLVGAVEFMHGKGIAHRDLKPENLLLSKGGELKVADFGLASVFQYKGERKLCLTSCGSPPYTAPEVLVGGGGVGRLGRVAKGYAGDMVDVWSCGVVLFVLLVGNTPWDEPRERSWEFDQYVKSGDGVPDDELWQNLPEGAVSLLKGMMCVRVEDRFGIKEVKAHPWFRRENAYLGEQGGLRNPVGLATEMFESMKIDFEVDPLASQRSSNGGLGDAMDMDGSQEMGGGGGGGEGALNEAKTPTQEITFDWERPSQKMVTATQGSSMEERLMEEPSLSQFTSVPQVPLTMTQHAKKYEDILSSRPLNQFFSAWPMDQVHGVVSAALHQLNMLDKLWAEKGNPVGSLKIRGADTRNCQMSGDVVIEKMALEDGGLLEISLNKVMGDNLEWRRMFKKVVVLCKDVVFRPERQIAQFSQMSQG